MNVGALLHQLLLTPSCRFCSRGKTARVINYEEFQKALEELAPKRFKDKSKEEALESLFQLVAGKEPVNLGVTVSSPHHWRWQERGMGGKELGETKVLERGWLRYGTEKGHGEAWL